jgi:LysM repeat protein
LVLILSGACGKAPPPRPPIPQPSDREVEKCLTADFSSTTTYTYHVLEEGQTLYRVSKMYNTTVNDLIEVNGIEDHTDIPIGTRLRIPGTVVSASGLIWPVPGKISSYYGMRRGRPHEGIDIPAPRGTPIRAAANGLIVASSGSLKGYSGYGRVIIIDHGKGIWTLYAHNSKNRVNSGSCIRAGEIIGEVGATGNATGDHLHFEVRKNGRPINPLNYLP